MKIGSVNGFNWDNGNIKKCQKHGVNIDEIEELFITPPEPLMVKDVGHSKDEDRFIAIGQNSNQRYIFIGFTIRSVNNERLIRPITALYMHNKEIERFTNRL